MELLILETVIFKMNPVKLKIGVLVLNMYYIDLLRSGCMLQNPPLRGLKPSALWAGLQAKSFIIIYMKLT